MPSSTPAVSKGTAFEITVIAQDPTITWVAADGRREILTSTVRIPREKLRAGPRSHRFFVVDHDLTTGHSQPPADIADNENEFFETFGSGMTVDDPALENPKLHAQNVFAIAARTLALFEFSLGRRIGWAFDAHQLFLVPNAQMQGNAYYDKNLQAILFGYLPSGDRVVRTCLSHDVVAHEVTHAILDGLRPRYLLAGLPDQPAFHEGLADLVALLSVFEMKEVLRRQLAAVKPLVGENRLSAAVVSEDELESSVLFAIAEQLGRAVFHQRAVRYAEPIPVGPWWRQKYYEPHERCKIVVAVVMRTLSQVWRKRVAPLIQAEAGAEWIDLDRTVEEGTKTAKHLLGMMIRSLDLLPPVEMEFEDVVDAVMAADEIANPDDPFDYRGMLRASFADYDIYEPVRNKRPVTDVKHLYRNTNARALGSSRDEVYRFIWNNGEAFNIDLSYRLTVTRVRTAVRIGEDGLAVVDVWADYVQELTLTAGELPKIRAHAPGSGPRTLTKPHGVSDDLAITLWGGGVLVFDQFGRQRWHMRKDLAWDDEDIDRQQRRLDYMAAHGMLADADTPAYTHRSLHGHNTSCGELW